MRVIAGTLRSRILAEVSHQKTRSTKDRAKETLFNMLYPIERFETGIDVFAGSGALGIEAISRGIKKCDFVEENPEAFQVLTDNLKQLDLIPQTHAFKDDAIQHLKRSTKKYDLILLDPPYHTSLLKQALDLISIKKRLKPQGIIVTLSHTNDSLDHLPAIKVVKSRQVGITKVTFYEWSD